MATSGIVKNRQITARIYPRIIRENYVVVKMRKEEIKFNADTLLKRVERFAAGEVRAVETYAGAYSGQTPQENPSQLRVALHFTTPMKRRTLRRSS
jgi:hypothetical protein